MTNSRLSFSPILPSNPKLIIFGSFPGVKSLEENQYYAHPQNQFWRLIGECLGEELHAKSYKDKLTVLKKHNIALWDVIKTCKREGSLDTKISQVTLNDFSIIKHIPVALFNGTMAAKFAKDVPISKKMFLPSSSPANTKKFEEKLTVWKQAINSII